MCVVDDVDAGLSAHVDMNLNQYVEDCSQALQQSLGSKTAIFLGGKALLAEGEQ